MKSNFARVSGYVRAGSAGSWTSAGEGPTYILEEVLGHGITLKEVRDDDLVSIPGKVIGEQLHRPLVRG